LGNITERINAALRGKDTAKLRPVLTRIGRGRALPHWYEVLVHRGTLPNLDGKTIGSVIEMLLVAVLETFTFRKIGVSNLRINPARGVDLPGLGLGIKSPSENYCTSKPFFSPYERLMGSDRDLIVLLTDYQTAKANPPLRLSVIASRYLRSSQVADKNLCALARRHREWIIDENPSWAKKAFRFLSFVNQSDWRAKWLLRIYDAIRDENRIRSLLSNARLDFERRNARALRTDKSLIPEFDITVLERIAGVTPIVNGVIDALDNWVVETWKDVGRLPNENQWGRLAGGPLDGAIGMSFALQWRYNFSSLFGASEMVEQQSAE
jgi:hypothetical protein